MAADRASEDDAVGRELLDEPDGIDSRAHGGV